MRVWAPPSDTRHRWPAPARPALTASLLLLPCPAAPEHVASLLLRCPPAVVCVCVVLASRLPLHVAQCPCRPARAVAFDFLPLALTAHPSLSSCIPLSPSSIPLYTTQSRLVVHSVESPRQLRRGRRRPAGIKGRRWQAASPASLAQPTKLAEIELNGCFTPPACSITASAAGGVVLAPPARAAARRGEIAGAASSRHSNSVSPLQPLPSAARARSARKRRTSPSLSATSALSGPAAPPIIRQAGLRPQRLAGALRHPGAAYGTGAARLPGAPPASLRGCVCG